MPTPDATAWNPGEPVIDQATGEPYIDAEGALLQVAPGLLVQVADGRTIDGDDVACAAWYRGNKYEGETLRDASIGVPYLRNGLGALTAQEAAELVVAEIRARTPGVSGVVSLQVLGVDAARVLRFRAVLLRQGGGEQAMVGGTALP